MRPDILTFPHHDQENNNEHPQITRLKQAIQQFTTHRSLFTDVYDEAADLPQDVLENPQRITVVRLLQDFVTQNPDVRKGKFIHKESELFCLHITKMLLHTSPGFYETLPASECLQEVDLLHQFYMRKPRQPIAPFHESSITSLSEVCVKDWRNNPHNPLSITRLHVPYYLGDNQIKATIEREVETVLNTVPNEDGWAITQQLFASEAYPSLLSRKFLLQLFKNMIFITQKICYLHG